MRQAIICASLLWLAEATSAVAQSPTPDGNVTVPMECPSHEAVRDIRLALGSREYFDLRASSGCRGMNDFHNTLFKVDYCDGAVLKATFLNPRGGSEYDVVRSAYFAISDLLPYILNPEVRNDCDAISKHWEETVWKKAIMEQDG